MKIGIPKEVKNHEYRVAITPAGVHELAMRGHDVFVETGAGEGASITDDELASVILGDDLVADAQVAQPFDSTGYARPDFDGPTLAELRARRRRWIAATLALVLVAVAGWLTYLHVVRGY